MEWKIISFCCVCDFDLFPVAGTTTSMLSSERGERLRNDDKFVPDDSIMKQSSRMAHDDLSN